MIKVLRKIMGKFLQLDEEYLQKPVVNIIFNNEMLKNFPLRSGVRQGCLLSPFYSI